MLFPAGSATEFTFSAILLALLVVFIYALLTTWVLVFLFRGLFWLFDKFTFLGGIRGLFPVFCLVLALVLWNCTAIGPMLVIMVGPVLLFLHVWFGIGQQLIIVPLLSLLALGLVALVWYPCGVYTGLGWMGLIAYGILSRAIAVNLFPRD